MGFGSVPTARLPSSKEIDQSNERAATGPLTT